MFHIVYLVPMLPLLAFFIISIITLRLKNVSSIISIFAVFSSFVISCKIGYDFLKDPTAVNLIIPWFETGHVQISLGAILDPISVMMIVVVSLVSLLIQIYSRGYMHGDPGFSRYYAFLSLFTFSMLLLVLSNNFIQMFISWELVGVCSYLLIGFWYYKPSATEAGKKAFIVTRVGDVGFLIGILLIFSLYGTFDFFEFSSIVEKGISSFILALIVILIFCGAVGKSAQLPLHVWLPDAMEGPTPVSALIHAATMVAAGVYLVARLFDVFSCSPIAMSIVAVIGCGTAIFSATIALAQNDIKRIIAYSTISQLGYMMLALGCYGYTAGTFHLMTHAFFKALLFLCAGSVIHAIHSNDIWDAGGLIRRMPITGWTFLVGALALSGIPPFSGFFSKEMVLVSVYHKNPALFILAIITVFLTATYIFRLFFVVFCGEEKGHCHESPPSMTIPMIILAILSVISGFWEHQVSHYIHFGDVYHKKDILITIISVFMAVFGIFLSWLIYAKKVLSLSNPIITPILANKYFVDEIYGKTVIGFTWMTSKISGLFDKYVIDGIINGLGVVVIGTGRIIRNIQTGFVQTYIFAIVIGVIFFIIIFL